MTVFTAIFGPYEALKEPMVVTPSWRYICYTDQPFTSNVWEIRKVIAVDPVLTARYIKIMFHEHIDDDFSIWVDGSFTINCDLDKFVAGNYMSPMTVIKHPLRDCIYREADACIQQKRGDWRKIEAQVLQYKKYGLPQKAGLIQSGILMRENVGKVTSFMIEWFKQVNENSTRDQIAFSYVASLFGWPHRIKFDYRNSKEFIFKHHNKHG